MAIRIKIEVMMAKRGMKEKHMAEILEIPLERFLKLRYQARAFRLSTMSRLCQALDCQPGDLFEYYPGPHDPGGEDEEA